ncbi:hypothetical protein C2S51_027220 [Perilla frutescens var. frutescens]|nr:hypothetical protein C2S51_027220 [Perilla frutescens var. frutescens]
MLPDETLVLILSRLTFNEAIASSLLSHRWRYMWTFIPRLIFDGTVSKKRRSTADEKSWDFVKWVEHAIALQKNSTIEELRVFFNLDKSHGKWIDGWLKYAFARKVQRLELNLTKDTPQARRAYDEYYTLPHNFLCDSVDFKCLKHVSMNMVNVNGEALEFLLHNSPLLEELSVSRSSHLSTLKIVGPLPLFKRLELMECHSLNSVEIRDVNLVHLKYHGKMIDFVMENASLLVSLSVGGCVTDNLQAVLFMFLRILAQLETFEIRIIRMFNWRDTGMFYSAVKMNCLKQLVVRAVSGDDSLLPLTSLMRASPWLHRFVLDARRFGCRFINKEFNKIVSRYPYLKEVEFVSYNGAASDLELIMHLVKNALNLNKIVIILRVRAKTCPELRSEEKIIRAQAEKRLRKFVPLRIELKFICRANAKKN